MPAIPEHPSAHSVDDDDLAAKLGQRATHAFETPPRDATYPRRRENPTLPARPGGRVVNRVDRDDDSDPTMASVRK